MVPVPRALAAITTAATPLGFPLGIPIARRTYENWATSLDIPGLWTARPKAAADVVRIVNWAHGAGWTVRARGSMHGWSPLTVTAQTTRTTKTVLVDTSLLTGASVISRAPAAVRFGAGTKMFDLLRSRRNDLVPVHDQAVAQGLECQSEQACAFALGERGLQLSVLRSDYGAGR